MSDGSERKLRERTRPAPYLRYPHISGELVTFVAENDLWLADCSGGLARRFSREGAPVTHPHFSLDGTRLLWTSAHEGAPEVMTAKVDGSDYRRLTWLHHASTRLRGVTPQGEALVISAFEAWDFRRTVAYAVALDDGSRRTLPYGPVGSVAYGPAHGTQTPVVVASPNMREPAWWKRYNGGAAGKLWRDLPGSGQFERFLPELDGNLSDVLWVGDRIAFIADHEGHGNLYSAQLDGGDLQRHTDFDDFYVRHLSTDGHRVAFESGGHLFLMGDLQADPQRLDIVLDTTAHHHRVRSWDVTQHWTEARPHHEGSKVLVETYGTAHVVDVDRSVARPLEVTPGSRARLVRPLGKHRAVYISDRGGSEALYVVHLETETETSTPPAADSIPSSNPSPHQASQRTPYPSRRAALQRRSVDGEDRARQGPGSDGTARDQQAVQHLPLDIGTRVCTLETSPDASSLLVGTEQGGVLLIDVATGRLRRLAQNAARGIEECAWSPDGQWIVWNAPRTLDGEQTQLWLAPVAATDDPRFPLALTDGSFQNSSPCFTADGFSVAFLSQRDYVVGVSGDVSGRSRPYLLDLRALLGASLDSSAFGGRRTSAALQTEESQPPLCTEWPLADPGVPLQVPAGNYRLLKASARGLFWIDVGEDRQVQSGARGNRLMLWEARREHVRVLARNVLDYTPLAQDDKVLIRVGDRLEILSIDSTKRSNMRNRMVDLASIRLLLSSAQIWSQIFEEAWRLQRDFYWDAGLANIDWDDIYMRYRPLVERLGSHDDLLDLLGELYGELGIAHLSIVGPHDPHERQVQGRLGANLRYEVTDGSWIVQELLDGGGEQRALNAPGADVRPGDTLVAIDGYPVGPEGPEKLLAGYAHKHVELLVRNGPSHGQEQGTTRRAVVTVMGEEEELRYAQRIHRNRNVVATASGGRFGYLHVPDLRGIGAAQWRRERERASQFDGIVVDLRGNRGGVTSHTIVDHLGHKVLAWGHARHTAEVLPFPADAPQGPLVVLCDELTGAEEDSLVQVFKLRELGPIAGSRTWGGTARADRSFVFIDGTEVRQPRYALWFPGADRWKVEQRGVEPHVPLDFPPQAYLKDEDPQLLGALEILEQMLVELPREPPPVRQAFGGSKLLGGARSLAYQGEPSQRGRHGTAQGDASGFAGA